MNELQIFNFDNSEVRTISIDGEPWFIGKDVANVLGYSDVKHAILDHVDEEDRVNSKTQGYFDPELGQRGSWLINESGLYSLILSSKLKDAKRFKRWVTSEVLPTLRKTGVYQMKPAYHLPQTFSEALRKLADVCEEKDKLFLENQEMKPKAFFADAVTASKTSILVAELAKLMRQNGLDIGERRLFGKLREDGFLMKRNSHDWNKPTQKAVDMGLMEVEESTVTTITGRVLISRKPMVTGKGQVYFINKYCNEVDTGDPLRIQS